MTRLLKISSSLYLLLLLTLAACRADALPATPVLSDNPSPLPTRSTPRPANPLTHPPTHQSTNSPTMSPPAIPRPAQGGMAVVGLVGQPDSLNPVLESKAALGELTSALFETLLRVEPQSASLQPGLAQSWEYADEGRQVIFHLPSNLKWSDGAPLTAAGVAQSLQATRHPALMAFSHINAPDPNTLVLTFARIDCAAVTTLARLPLLRASEITATIPTGSGPFMVKEWSENKRSLSLVRNPNYHASAAWLDGLTVRFIPGDGVAIALSEGQFDLVGPLQAPIRDPSLNFTTLTYAGPQMVYLAINFDPHNGNAVAPQVRQALRLALDRQAILDEALAGDGQLLSGPLLPGHWAANNSLALPDYDPETARTLLAGAGLRDTDGDGWLDQNGQRLELAIRLNGQNRLHQALGWLVSSYYRDLGLFVRAEGVPFDSIVDDLFTHDFKLAIFSWPILPDPDQRLYWHSTENSAGSGLNFVSYNSPQVDNLLEQAVAVPGCQAQDRAGPYRDLQAILANESPVDFLLAPNRHVLLGSRLQGVQPGPFAPLTWNVADWHLPGE